MSKKEFNVVSPGCISAYTHSKDFAAWPEAQNRRVVYPNLGVKIYSDGRETCMKNLPGKRLYKIRLKAMLARQGNRCRLCHKPLFFVDATFDHENGRGAGGGFRDDRIVMPDGSQLNAALCYSCNQGKGSKRGYGEVADCSHHQSGSECLRATTPSPSRTIAG